MVVTQFYCRQPKSLELIEGPVAFGQVQDFTRPSFDCKNSCYSSNGKVLAYTQPKSVVLVNPENGKTIAILPVEEVFDLHFSPLGKYLCTWSKPICLNKESGIWNNNVKIWEILKFEGNGDIGDDNNVEMIGEFSNKNQAGWKPQFTADESLMSKTINQHEIQFFQTKKKSTINFILEKPFAILNSKEFGKIQNFAISPGKNPSIAIFIPENNGKPASIKVYNIPNFNQPVSQKQFFKAEKCQFKWNSLGTSLLALVSTDVDQSNKSYYGETTLYLLGIIGSFDQRINLDKEGPIHDITWSPSSREFAVSYGYMPAATTFFDARGNSIYSLPPAPRNTILFSPHAKFVLVAGFGNLQGTVDIYDRQNKFAKITSFEASNTSVCAWSPDGRYILTATTSPRLRVDNCAKIWHASGVLLYYKPYQELFGVSWRPQDLSLFPPLKKLEDPLPQHESAIEFLAKRKSKSSTSSGSSEKKSTGAYRPPHARNGANGGSNNNSSTSLYEREMKSNGSLATARTVPGATPVGTEASESKSASKNRKRKQKKELAQKEALTSSSPSPAAAAALTDAIITPSSTPGAATAAATVSTSNSTNNSNNDSNNLVYGGVQSMEEKKIRSLLKKLRAIENLKEKQAIGEPLEETQILKIQTEDKVKSELEKLGYKC